LISYDSVTLTESLFWGIGIMALERSEIPDMGVGDWRVTDDEGMNKRKMP
jgi:hypothetical protein